MQQIIDFILRKKYVVVYLILLLFCISLIYNKNSFQKSKVIVFFKSITNYSHEIINNSIEYLELKRINSDLFQENLVLKNQLEKVNESSGLDSLTNEKFLYKNAKVISNNLSSFKNKIIINKGIRDGIKNEMGVISSDGIVGIIDNTTKRYSSIMSILNIEMKINAKVKRTEHFGTLEWDGFDTRHLTLNDISETAKIKVGDSIITGGMSLIFPEGINIGTVSKIINQNEPHSNTKDRAFNIRVRDDSIIDLDIRENYLNIEVKLHNDMSNLNHVYVIESLNKDEFQNITK